MARQDAGAGGRVAVPTEDRDRLGAAVEAWLARGRGARMTFPPALEAKFEADTRAERSRSMALFNGVGTIIGLLLYPSLLDALPDVARLTRILYLDISMPLGLAVSILLATNPKPFRRELMQWVSTVFNSLCVTYLFAVSHGSNAPLFVGGIMLLIVYGALGVNLRFAFAAALTVLVIGGFQLGIAAMPAVDAVTRHHIMLVMLVFAIFVLWANWRQETELRRSYLFALRERLRHQDLSVRNLELDVLVRRDALTGLANRRAYDAWLQDSWAQARAAGGEVGLIIVDVDYFKAYNDFYGHAGGDACLQSLGRCLREQLRGTSDLVARFGGEEFAVLLPRLGVETCSDIAERLRVVVESLQMPNLGAGAGCVVTISAGVSSQSPAAGRTPESLFAATDAALYQAKQTGRNRVCIGTPGEGVLEGSRSGDAIAAQ